MKTRLLAAAMAAGLVMGAAPSAMAQGADPYLSLLGGLTWSPNVIAEADLGGGCDPWPGPPCTPFVVELSHGLRFGAAAGLLTPAGWGLEWDVLWTRAFITGAGPIGGAITPLGVDATATLWTTGGNVVFAPDTGKVRPIFGVGGGLANLALDVPAGSIGADEVDDNDWTWMAQAYVGFEVSLSDKVAIGVRYRFQHIGYTEFLDGGSDNVHVFPFNVHAVEFGLTIGR